MDEKNTNVPNEKKPGEGKEWPETGKQGGDVGKKGGDLGGHGGDMGKGVDQEKKQP